MAWAHIEPFTGVIVRVFADDKQFGDKYQYSLACREVGDGEYEAVGVVAAPKLSEMRAMVKAFRRRGWRVFQTRRSGARQGKRLVV